MKKILSLLILVVGAILVHDIAPGQALRASENLRREAVLLPPSVPDKSAMAVTDTVMFVEAEGAAGILVFYDDPRTRWEFDYVEFYDLDGNLLLVSWLDRRGLCQAAMDLGLLDVKRPVLMGVFVAIPVGGAV